MTFVAAYRTQGIPMLMGDLLITGPGNDEILCRKIRRFGPNLVIAWTGHLFVAKKIFRDLQEKIAYPYSVDREWLENHLKSYQSSDFGELEVELVGWIIDDQQHCFHWYSKCPEFFLYSEADEAQYAGSGVPVCQRYFDEHGMIYGSGENSFDRTIAIQSSLTVITHLMAEEIYKTGLLDLFKFGSCFEFFYWTDNGFRCLNDTIYMALTVDLDGEGNAKSIRLEQPVYKYLESKDYAFVSRISFTVGAKSPSVVSSHPDKDTEYRMISYAGLRDFEARKGPNIAKELYKKSQKKGFLKSDYYCIFLKMSGPNYPLNFPGTIVYSAGWPEDSPVRIHVSDNGELNIEVNDGLFKTAFALAQEATKSLSSKNITQ